LEIILLLLADENPFFEPEILINDGNSTKLIKPPMLFGDGTLTKEG